MKKILLSLVVLFFVLNLFSQSKTKVEISKDNYLLKSKKQKTAAWILLAGGAALVTTSFIIPDGEATGDLFPYPVTTNKNDGIKVAFGLTGAASMLGSIPLFLASGKNKRKARATTVSLNSQKILFPLQNTFVLSRQPTLTFKIEL